MRVLSVLALGALAAVAINAQEVTYSVLTTACGTDTAFLSNPSGHTLTSCETLCTDTELCDSIGFNAGTGNCVIRSNMYCDTAAGWVYYEQVVPVGMSDADLEATGAVPPPSCMIQTVN